MPKKQIFHHWNRFIGPKYVQNWVISMKNVLISPKRWNWQTTGNILLWSGDSSMSNSLESAIVRINTFIYQWIQILICTVVLHSEILNKISWIFELLNKKSDELAPKNCTFSQIWTPYFYTVLHLTQWSDPTLVVIGFLTKI